MISKRSLAKWASSLTALALFTVAVFVGVSPSYAYAGTLENGNLAYAASEFNLSLIHI